MGVILTRNTMIIALLHFGIIQMDLQNLRNTQCNKKKLALTSPKPQANTQAHSAFASPAVWLHVIGNFRTHYFTSLFIHLRNKTLLWGFIRATIIRLSNVEVGVHSKVYLVSNSSSRLSADACKAEKRKCKRSGALEQYLHQAVISIEVQP